MTPGGSGPLPSNTDPLLKTARKRALLSICVNVLLASFKGAAGYLSGSTALVSDAIHSATDVLGSTASYLGLWVAGKRHPSFPYGLYKAETVATLVTSMAVLLAAYEIGRRALFGSSRVVDVGIALPVAVLSLLVSLAFGLFQLRAGRSLNSPALVADARDYLADCLSTTVVLAGLGGSYYGVDLDRWAAAIVSLFVFRAGGELLVTALKDLLDAAIDRDTEREIIRLVESHPSVMRVQRCLSRTTGGRFIVDMDVVLKTPSSRQADSICDRMEEKIVSRFPMVVLARIRPHFERPEKIRRITPVKGPEGEMSPHLAKAPWFLLEEIDRSTGKIVSVELMSNPHKDAERKRGYLVGKFLLEHKPDQVVNPGRKQGTAVALLEEAGVEILQPG